MAEKSFEIEIAGEKVHVTQESAINREELYGKEKITIEKDGPLEKVVLAPWGAIFRPEEFKNQRIDSSGTTVEKPETCDESGAPLEIHTTSFKTTRAATPAQWTDLATFKTKSVMPAKCELPPGLYKTQFCYRDTTDIQDAFLIIKPEGEAFLLTGELANVPFRGKEETYDFFDVTETEEDEEMSFGMF